MTTKGDFSLSSDIWCLHKEAKGILNLEVNPNLDLFRKTDVQFKYLPRLGKRSLTNCKNKIKIQIGLDIPFLINPVLETELNINVSNRIYSNYIYASIHFVYIRELYTCWKAWSSVYMQYIWLHTIGSSVAPSLTVIWISLKLLGVCADSMLDWLLTKF